MYVISIVDAETRPFVRSLQEAKNGQSASSSSGKKSEGESRKRSHDTENNNNEHGAFMAWFTDTNGETNNDEFAEVIKDDIFVNPLQYYLVSRSDGMRMEGIIRDCSLLGCHNE